MYVLIIYPQKSEIDRKPGLGDNTNKDYVQWSKIIITKEGFESFANFLQKEFSVENLLFVTEVC